jgi:hypothetical protein
MLRPSVKIMRKKKGGKIKSIGGGPERVKVGFPAGKADGGVIQRAVWNEFGTRGGASGGGWGGPVPERPFMRNAMRNGKGEISADLVKAAKSILRGAALGQEPMMLKRTALRKLGIKAQGLIQQEIASLTSPANSPVTIARKGSSKPLIDSGEMAQAVTWKIDE